MWQQSKIDTDDRKELNSLFSFSTVYLGAYFVFEKTYQYDDEWWLFKITLERFWFGTVLFRMPKC